MVDTVVEVNDLLKTGLGCLVFALHLYGKEIVYFQSKEIEGIGIT